MEDSERNSKRRDEIAAVGSPTISSFPKKMKIQIDFNFDGLNLPSHQDHRFSALSPDKKISPVASSNSGEFIHGGICSGDSVACRSFSIESNLLSKDNSSRVVDLEAKSFETESSTCIDNKFRETTPSSKSDTDEMDSTAERNSSNEEAEIFQAEQRDYSTAEAIERFFAEAEKEMREKQKQFMEKYNFDVVNDVPLEGRYEWVRLNP